MKNFYDKNKLIAIILLVLFVLLMVIFISIIVYNFHLNNENKEISTIVIEEQPDDIFKGVVESDMIDKYELDSSLGKLSEVNVTDGQEVNQGDTILTYIEILDNSSIDMTSLRFAIESANQTLDNANQDLSEAKTKDSELRSEYYKASEEKKDEIRNKIETNNELLKTTSRTVQSAKLALDQANSNLMEAETRISQNSKINTVKAKNSGIVMVSDGNSDNTSLVQILSPKTNVIAQISEFDFDRISVGQEVSVEPINSNQEYIGLITSITSIPLAKTTDSNVTYYEFKVNLDTNIQNGFSVQVHLKKSGYIIPKTAILDNQVKIKKNNDYVLTPVQIEEINGKVIVKEGLKKGDTIAENFEDAK